MRLTMEVLGDRIIDREMLRSGMRATEAEPAFHAISDKMQEGERMQFDTEGGYGSGGWTPLKPATIAAKAAAGLDPRILQATTTMMQTLSEDTEGSIREVSPMGLKFGTSVPYAIFHQQGTKKMAMRKPVEFPEMERREFVKILQRWIVEGVVA
jgi:phage gpG-like protein